MASQTKSVIGNTTTYVITDMTGAAATVTVTTGVVTGNTVAYSGASVHEDAINMIAQLSLQLATGLLP